MKHVLVFLLAFFFVAGCASDDTDRERAMSGDEDYRRVATDPVTGEAVRTDSMWKTRWNDRWYYFASEESLRKFEADPRSYVREDRRRSRPERRTVYPHQVQ